MVLGQLPPRKFALSQTLTLTGKQFAPGTIIWLPLNPKNNPDLDPNHKPNRGQLFSEGTVKNIVLTYCGRMFFTRYYCTFDSQKHYFVGLFIVKLLTKTIRLHFTISALHLHICCQLFK